STAGRRVLGCRSISIQARSPLGARARDPDCGAEADEGLAERGDRQGDADGEHGAGGRHRRAEPSVPPVSLLPLASALRILAAACRVPPPGHARQETHSRRRMLAGVGRSGTDPRADPLESVRPRFQLIRGSVQLATQELAELGSLRRSAVVSGSAHYSCSRAPRRAVLPRAGWLFTAPPPRPIAVADSPP